MLALPAHLSTGLWDPRQPVAPVWGLSHLAKQFTSACPRGLTPSRLVGNGNQGLNMCLCPHSSLYPSPASITPAPTLACASPVLWHGGKAALPTARLTVTGINY